MIRLYDQPSVLAPLLKPLYPAFLLLMLPEAVHALEWRDLWSTPDQQGKKAFQQQQYEQAAGQFDNPEWKAASQYKAGQFEQVLDTLKDVQTSEGFYNKGNAHVKQGQLKEALEAYEKSLKIDPENADARYNKELVEKELENQKQQQQNQGDSGDQDQQQEQNRDQQSDSDTQNQQGEQSNDGQEQDQQESESQAENQQNGDQKESEAETNQTENQPEENEESAKQANSEQSAEEETGEEAEATAAETSTELKDESEQASEQWLKRIPDDPAGLLKRKFEYQYKQRKGSRSQQENW